MKNTLKLMMALLLLLSLCGCGDNKEETSVSDSSEKKEEVTEKEEKNEMVTASAIETEINETEDGYEISFSRMAVSTEDIEGLDNTNEYVAACAVVFALAEYENDEDECFEMMDYINGPDEFSDYAKNHIENQAEQYPYVMRSYFKDATPDNDYTVGDITITVKENIYSRDEEGYVKLYLHSNGADNDRPITLRQKKSTGEWFVYSDSFYGLMAGIREPASQDAWN